MLKQPIQAHLVTQKASELVDMMNHGRVINILPGTMEAIIRDAGAMEWVFNYPVGEFGITDECVINVTLVKFRIFNWLLSTDYTVTSEFVKNMLTHMRHHTLEMFFGRLRWCAACYCPSTYLTAKNIAAHMLGLVPRL